MAIHIWCPRASDSAIRLRDALNLQGIPTYKSPAGVTTIQRSRRFFRRVKPGDVWLNWGQAGVTGVPNLIDLNRVTHINKKEQLVKLAAAGVPCPKVFEFAGPNRLGRSFKHQGGSDLIQGTGRDFYTEKLELHHEVRIHIFQGVSIRAGMKVPRPGVEQHPWIRTYTAGWKIDYSKAEKIRKDRRDLARTAIQALGLDFGAVDIGVDAKGKPYVLEVNLAPGLDEGGSVNAYVQHLAQVHNQRLGI